MAEEPKVKEIKITLDGRTYTMQPGRFSYRELGIIRDVSGLRAGEIVAAAKAGDVMLVVALAAVAMRRDGTEVDVDKLLDRDTTEIEIELVKEDSPAANPPVVDDAEAPVVTPEPIPTPTP